jgi:hypothetical protein
MPRKIVSRRPIIRDPLFPLPYTDAWTEDDAYEAAVVVDVITNDSHPLYSADGYTAGTIRFRLLAGDRYIKDTDLGFAYPLDSNIAEHPLQNEIVLIFEALGRWYYTRKLSISNSVSNQAIFGLNSELSPLKVDSRGKIDNTIGQGPTKSDPPSTSTSLGKTFKDNPSVKKLRHEEGDLVLEGRSGHSVRIGTDKINHAPNILLRAGQGGEIKHELVSEDINKDPSSIHIVSNETIPLEYSTKNSPVHLKSIHNPPKTLSGAQVIVNSDRILFNARRERIFGFSLGGIHWTTAGEFTVDSEKNYYLFSNKEVHIESKDNSYTNVGKDQHEVVTGTSTVSADSKTLRIAKDYNIVTQKSIWRSSDHTAIIAPKIYLGSDREEEPIVVGQSLAMALNNLVRAMLMMAPAFVMTPMGPGALNGQVVAALTQLQTDLVKGKLASFNSRVSFTKK